MESLERKLQTALDEISELKKENKSLKRENNELKRQIQTKTMQNNQHIETNFNNARKIELNRRMQLYKSIFKGREDVFAYLWENNSGEAGYSPARKQNGTDFSPITDEVLYDHLTGKRVIGLYPLLKDNTCWFLSVDFDKHSWQEDSLAFVATCKHYDIPASIERSRSGNGCHVWIFFNERVPAFLARRLGDMLLANSLKGKQGSGMSSYDRMFPNQDVMPEGKFGNLIALPLQAEPRKKENSVFVDENFKAYSDQWLYLSQVRKITKKDIESVIDMEQSQPTFVKEMIVDSDIPERVNAVYKNGIFISKRDIPIHLVKEIAKLAQFGNPAFYSAEKRRMSTKGIPRVIDCSDDNGDFIILPRGCDNDIENFFENKSIEFSMKDLSYQGEEIDVTFTGQLSVQQEDALESLLSQKIGILAATTGFGKTVVAAALIAKRKVNTLIIVHRKQLMDQWRERLAVFLNIAPTLIGQIGGGKNNPNYMIDLAMIQSLNYGGTVKETIKKYGQVIVDECHHFAAFSFEKVLKEVESTYVLGLTATPKRKDKLERIMKMQLGPIRYQVSAKEQAKVRPFKHILIPRMTLFKSRQNKKGKTVQSLYSEIAMDEKRNAMIFNDVLMELEQGSTPIIITERLEHVLILTEKFQGFTKNMIVLTGELSKREAKSRLEYLHGLSDEQERLVIATGKYIGEGFDYAKLDTMFLVMPFSWDGTLQQYVGRLHRLYENKTEVKVYDYIDYNEPVLADMYKNRETGYKTLGYVVKGDRSSASVAEQLKLF